MLAIRPQRSLHNLYPKSSSECYYSIPVSSRFSASSERISNGGLPPPPPLLARRFSNESSARRFSSESAVRYYDVPTARKSALSNYFLIPSPPDDFRPIARSYMDDIGYARRLPSDVRMMDAIDDSFIGPVVTTFGTICLYLDKFVRVDMTLDNSIRVVNSVANCKAAIDGRGDTSCLVHPSGDVHQSGSQVQVQTSGMRRAKMTSRGITFSTRDSPVVYLLDEGGVKTTVDSFRDLSDDHSLSVFYGSGSDDRCGEPQHVRDCLNTLRGSGAYRCKSEQVWIINGVRVGQHYATGDVTVVRDQGRRIIKTSAARGTVSITTPYLYACASLPPEAHVFCRRGERRVHGSDTFFSVRNGTQSAGYDDGGRLRIF